MQSQYPNHSEYVNSDEYYTTVDRAGEPVRVQLGGPWSRIRIEQTLAIVESQPYSAAYDLCQIVSSKPLLSFIRSNTLSNPLSNH